MPSNPHGTLNDAIKRTSRTTIEEEKKGPHLSARRHHGAECTQVQPRSPFQIGFDLVAVGGF